MNRKSASLTTKKPTRYACQCNAVGFGKSEGFNFGCFLFWINFGFGFGLVIYSFFWVRSWFWVYMNQKCSKSYRAKKKVILDIEE